MCLVDLGVLQALWVLPSQANHQDPTSHTNTHGYNHIRRSNQHYFKQSVHSCVGFLKVILNKSFTGSPLCPSAPSLPLSPCGIIQKNGTMRAEKTKYKKKGETFCKFLYCTFSPRSPFSPYKNGNDYTWRSYNWK